MTRSPHRSIKVLRPPRQERNRVCFPQPIVSRPLGWARLPPRPSGIIHWTRYYKPDMTRSPHRSIKVLRPPPRQKRNRVCFPQPITSRPLGWARLPPRPSGLIHTARYYKPDMTRSPHRSIKVLRPPPRQKRNRVCFPQPITSRPLGWAGLPPRPSCLILCVPPAYCVSPLSRPGLRRLFILLMPLLRPGLTTRP